ncbi:MAG: Aryl-alcohol dehydrogenase [Solirubrobacterales bacterium]|nr:Aryl-alcohol dehydrogenase [Solirubrobacterales bacterium]
MSTQILAAVAHAPEGDFAFETLTLAAPGPGEVLVEIKGVGLCHTDLVAREGLYELPYPLVVGHEGAGVVVEVGEGVSAVAPGDHVALSFNSCGHCVSCEDGAPSYCLDFPGQNYGGGVRPDGTGTLTLDGAPVSGSFFGQSSFASHALANEHNVVKVDPDLPIELLGPLGCGIQTGAGSVMNVFACPPGSSLLVLGGGPVGLAAVMGAVVQGCGTIVVSEPFASRRELALKLGATHVLDPAAGPLDEQVRALLPAGVDYAFDTTGSVPVLEAVIASMAHRGTIGLVGVPKDFADSLPVNLITAMVLGLTVRGIVEGDSDPMTFIPRMLELYREGRFPFDEMITTYPFDQLNAAVAAQHAGEVVKVVLVAEGA